MMKTIAKKKSTILLLLTMALLIVVGMCIWRIEPWGNSIYAEEEPVAESPVIEELFSFSLFNNSTEYKIKIRNKDLTEVEIPQMYNGIPVTEIADNGFINCKNLITVTLNGVTRIGNNAFANCINLENVIGLGRVNYLGNNAFANCVKLDNVVIPSRMDRLGATIFRNNPNTIYSRMSEENMYALSSNWNASMAATGETVYIEENELLYKELIEDGEIIGYSINRGQNIYDHSDEHFEISSTFNGLPVLEIEAYAFSFCEFKSLSIKHTDPNANHYINIRQAAFCGLDAEYIDIQVDISLNDPDSVDKIDVENLQYKSDNVFAASTIRHITLPDSIDIIPQGSFSECANLREILSVNPHIEANHLSDKIKFIGSETFWGCTSLLNLYIPNSIKVMGNSVFHDWGVSENDVQQTVHFDLYEPGSGCSDGCDGRCCVDCKPDCDGSCCYAWDINWKGTTFPNAKFEFKTMQVTLDKNGGKGGIGTNSVVVAKGEDMPEAIRPERDNYEFLGYNSAIDGNGKMYYDGNMASISVWDKKEDATLYAIWKACEYEITFDKQGGSGGSDSKIAEYGKAMPIAEAPTYIGRSFDGYYTQPNGAGNKYYNADMSSVRPCDFSSDTTLYANWIKIYYRIDFDKQGGSGGTYSADVAYGEDMPVIVSPTRSGYTFEGYYTVVNGGGIKYYDANTKPTRKWDKTVNTVLYAKWSIIEYEITYDINGWMGSTVTIPTQKKYTVESNDIIFSTQSVDGLTVSWTPSSISHGSKGDKIVKLIATENLLSTETTYIASTCKELNIILPSSSLTCKITVSSNVETLSISGYANKNYGIYLVADERYAALNLNLVNVIMQAPDGYTAIKTAPDTVLNLSARGTVQIKGGNGYFPSRGISGVLANKVIYDSSHKDGMHAIDCGTLRIVNSDGLVISGGNGADGKGHTQFGYGNSGGNAGAAVYVHNNALYLDCNNISFYAGTAGDGVDDMQPGGAGRGSQPIVGTDDVSIYVLKTLENTDNILFYASNNGKKGEQPTAAPKPPTIDPPDYIDPSYPVYPPIITV